MSNMIVIDGSGTSQYLRAFGTGTNSDPFVMSNSNLYLDIAADQVAKAISVHKFGVANDIDSGDANTPSGDGIPAGATIWDGASDDLAGDKIPQYTFSTTADIGTITSSSGSDNHSVEIQGLDTNWNLVQQDVTLNGQTDVSLGTPLIRVFRMINRGTTNVAGTIYLRTNGSGVSGGIPTDDSSVRAIIKDDDNQTQMALYTVPAGRTLYITHGWSSVASNRDGYAVIKIFQRAEGSVFRSLHTLALHTEGTSSDHRPYQVPLKLSEKTDIIYQVVDVSTNGMGVSAGFHSVLVEE